MDEKYKKIKYTIYQILRLYVVREFIIDYHLTTFSFFISLFAYDAKIKRKKKNAKKYANENKCRFVYQKM